MILDQVPYEVVEEMFSYLPMVDMMHVSLINRRMRMLSKNRKTPIRHRLKIRIASVSVKFAMVQTSIVSLSSSTTEHPIYIWQFRTNFSSVSSTMLIVAENTAVAVLESASWCKRLWSFKASE